MNAVSRRLTTEELRSMNGEILEGRPVREVVEEWLLRHLPEAAG